MRRHLLRFLALIPVLAAPGLAAAADRPPVESFFRQAEVGFVRLSPSGRYVLTVNRLEGGGQALLVRETADLKKFTVAATLESARLARLAALRSLC